jgi:hypothetical protein
VSASSGRTGPRGRPRAHGSSATTGVSRSNGRVLTADPGREFAFVTEEGGRESTVWRYQFAPVRDGILVTESYEVR